ncbi:hypothetical protein CEE36_08410 [candidate division TA06 bacterium B3_TA06]|uniref:Uncharacterized protein n=1 Tax=candidate division TA06 bacterium B3_TA06 TaxID=2012487 RepID=A0A532V2D7_UNCT6|nr:MAG: hypothetical protein CEE36_08410 [candidate division TA06 bacterium B3_TA06]
MHPKQTLHVCLGTPKIYAPFALRAKDRNKDKNEATDRFFCDLFASSEKELLFGAPIRTVPFEWGINSSGFYCVLHKPHHNMIMLKRKEVSG